MRDPDATLSIDGVSVTRTMRAPVRSEDFLRSNLAQQWVDSERLLPYEMLDEHRLRTPYLPFVTHPNEWCDAQLWHAAKLTLNLHAEAVEHGYDLKDASAWNVLFEGTKPRLCDHSSVVMLRERKWWAAGQFGRHFLLPLLLSRKCGLRTCQSFGIWRDGVPPESAAGLLGKTRFLTRYWPLMTTSRRFPRDIPRTVDVEIRAADLRQMRRFREGLQASLEWMLQGVGVGRPSHGSAWSGYVDQRSHYAGDSAAKKHDQVANWLMTTKPEWTADLGCNIGEFSELALEVGSSVVALDGDHDSVQSLYMRNRESGLLYPVVAQLDDLSAGRGWAGIEHRGLPSRMEKAFDMVMMLALVHHLAVGAAVPLSELANLAKRLTRRWLIVEFVGRDDSQLRRLCAQRTRSAEDFGLELQLQAFLDSGFVVAATLDLAPTPRILALLELAP